MKNFTRFAASVACLLVGMSAFAQYDLEATELRTMSTTSNEVPPNIPLTLTLIFENTGTTDVPDQSAALLVFLNGLDTLQVVNGVFNGAMTVGATYSFNSDPITLPAAPPNVNLCGFVLLDTALGEVDTSNNLICDQFQVSSSAIVDLSAVGISVNSPNDLDGFDVDNGNEEPDNITDMHSTYKNEGNVTFPAGFIIPYVYEFDGNPTAIFQGNLVADLAPGDSIQRPSVDPGFEIPAEKGDYEVCVYTVYGDADLSNDTICWGWSMIDAYLPPPPIGIEEENGFQADLNVYNLAKAVWIMNISEPTSVTITDMNGRIIANEQMINDCSINLETAAAGVYIVRTLNNTTGAASMHKVSVQ